VHALSSRDKLKLLGTYCNKVRPGRVLSVDPSSLGPRTLKVYGKRNNG
jgi:hypothetical protein